jgi:peptidyl-prolyl cis-trans isomerase SurA
LDDEFYTFKWRPAELDYKDNKLITMGDSFNATIDDFAEFCRKNTRSRLKYDKTVSKKEIVGHLIEEYSNIQIMKYEQENLEDKYPDFKSLMREYEEGILLFEATKMEVWDKANQDTIGLYEYYENYKNNYMWDERATVSQYIIHSTDDKLAEDIRDYAKKKSSEDVLKKFNKKEEVVEWLSKDVDLSSNELTGMERKKDAISSIVKDEKSNLQMFRKIEEVLEGKRKTMQEARGYIVADYQGYLETKWIAKLRNTFPIEMNEAVYNKLVK